jgi:hypothetical protein
MSEHLVAPAGQGAIGKRARAQPAARIIQQQAAAPCASALANRLVALLPLMSDM